MGSLGKFFVKQEFRNLGIGQLIWDARMRYLSNMNVIVNAMERRANKNVQLGFHHQVQELDIYNGISNSHTPVFQKHINDFDEIIPIADAKFEQLVKYDKYVGKIVDRSCYLNAAIKKYRVRGFVALKSHIIVGYIGESPDNDFTAIGPWYADSAQIAEALFIRFVTNSHNKVLFKVVCPRSNENASGILSAIGWRKMGSMKSLSTTSINNKEITKVYGIFHQTIFLW